MGVSHTHSVRAAALYRCALCILSVVYLVYVWCAHESLGGKTGNLVPVLTSLVQNQTSRSDTRGDRPIHFPEKKKFEG